jgi:hypothetical protein
MEIPSRVVPQRAARATCHLFEAPEQPSIRGPVCKNHGAETARRKDSVIRMAVRIQAQVDSFV